MSDFWTTPGVLTKLDKGADLEVPASIPELCAAIAELGVCDKDPIQWRFADEIAVGMKSPRLPCNCRAYVVVMVAVLRMRGVPARARCGFATYIVDEFGEDHWVAEYYDQGWKQAAPQFDSKRKVDVCTHDLPAGAFLSAGEAWQACRRGKDPNSFGLHEVPVLRGYWFIAGNIVRDACALLKIEMNPWDCWGPMQPPHAPWPEDDLRFFDNLADLTVRADLEGLLRLYKEPESPIKLPMAILNPIANQVDQLPCAFDAHLY